MKRYSSILLVVSLILFMGCGSSGEQTPSSAQQVQALLEKGQAQFQKQDYDAALASFTKAVEMEPKSAVAFNMQGMAYRFKYNQVRNKQLKDKEIAAFQKAIEVDPNYWVALINLGATYYYIGDKAKAMPLFKKALELNPQHPEKEQLERIIAEGGQKP